MDKAAAEKEAIRLWRALPVKERMSLRQAVAFAKTIAPELEFETLGNRARIVEGWIAHDFMRTAEAVKAFDEKQGLRPRGLGAPKKPTPIYDSIAAIKVMPTSPKSGRR
jgi:hypothetical protein